MMERWRNSLNKGIMRMLTWLGIGSGSLLFMACYGPMPKNYEVVDGEDSVCMMEDDSVVMVINNESCEIRTEIADTTAIGQ